MTSEMMQDPEIPIEEIKAEIRESFDRVKQMVADSERFVRDHSQLLPEAAAQ